MQIWKTSTPDEGKIKELSAQTGLSRDLVRLLSSRGFDSVEKVNSLIGEAPLCNPYDIIDMDRAVERIELALDRKEPICIYGDYDADGVTATALLVRFFREKHAKVSYYIPDRHTEGYGINNEAVEKIHSSGTKLIITVDNGISAVKEAEYIKELGMELVVTDHHRVGDELPVCCAVVDPHREDCATAFRDWCGVGIAFKLICALEDGNLKLRKVLTDIPGSLRRGMNSKGGLDCFLSSEKTEELLDKYADIVTVGTIGDVVSLTGENRTVVRRGLKKLSSRDGISPGLEALLDKVGVKAPLTSTSVAFSVVPKLNAVGRLSTADAAVELLLCENAEDAAKKVEEIIDFNDSRQNYSVVIERDIDAQIANDPSCLNERVLIFTGKNWHDGLIGIVAARCAEQYGKPCLVITYDDENAKGSGRSIEGFSLFECITGCSHLLTHFGGHPMAAGFSLKTEDLEAFKKAVNDYAKTVEMPFQQLKIDCALTAGMLSIDFLNEVERLEPFGQDNPQPVFLISGAVLNSFRFVGKDKNHVRLGFAELPAPVMKFRVAQEQFPFRIGDRLDLAVTLNKNEFNGVTSVSVHARDIRFSALNDERFLRSVRGYERFRRAEPLDQRQLSFITPDREYITAVYKLIRANGGWAFGCDALCARLGDDGSRACRLMLALDVLFEIGVLERKGDEIVLPQKPVRADLNNSRTFNELNTAGG